MLSIQICFVIPQRSNRLLFPTNSLPYFSHAYIIFPLPTHSPDLTFPVIPTPVIPHWGLPQLAVPIMPSSVDSQDWELSLRVKSFEHAVCSWLLLDVEWNFLNSNQISDHCCVFFPSSVIPTPVLRRHNYLEGVYWESGVW